MYNNENYYLDLFQVTRPQLENLVAAGIKEGGSYSDLFFENTTYQDLLLRDGIVSSGGFHIDYGVGIRVLKGDRTGYAYSESTDAKSMSGAVKAAALIAASGPDRPLAPAESVLAPLRPSTAGDQGRLRQVKNRQGVRSAGSIGRCS